MGLHRDYMEFTIEGLGSKLLKGDYIKDYAGDVIKGDTRSLDYNPCNPT